MHPLLGGWVDAKLHWGSPARKRDNYHRYAIALLLDTTDKQCYVKYLAIIFSKPENRRTKLFGQRTASRGHKVTWKGLLIEKAMRKNKIHWRYRLHIVVAHRIGTRRNGVVECEQKNNRVRKSIREKLKAQTIQYEQYNKLVTQANEEEVLCSTPCRYSAWKTKGSGAFWVRVVRNNGQLDAKWVFSSRRK